MGLFEHRRKLHAMKRLYNWFHNFYGGIEKWLSPTIDEVIKKKILLFPDLSSKTALEYACGSGALSLRLGEIFKSVDGRDLSKGMLERARMRAKEAGIDINFREGNLLKIDEKEKSYDYVFISYALHLLSPENEKITLKKLLSVAKKALIIIDHNKKWNLATAITEWLEGGYYDKFIRLDFKKIAEEIGVSGFEEDEVGECQYMAFYP